MRGSMVCGDGAAVHRHRDGGHRVSSLKSRAGFVPPASLRCCVQIGTGARQGAPAQLCVHETAWPVSTGRCQNRCCTPHFCGVKPCCEKKEARIPAKFRQNRWVRRVGAVHTPRLSPRFSKLAKNSSAYFLATLLMRRAPSCMILPPTCALNLIGEQGAAFGRICEGDLCPPRA